MRAIQQTLPVNKALSTTFGGLDLYCELRVDLLSEYWTVAVGMLSSGRLRLKLSQTFRPLSGFNNRSCTAASAAQCRSNPVSGRSLRKTGIIQ